MASSDRSLAANPVGAFQLVWGRYTQLEGRASRQEYWMFHLALWIAIVGTHAVGALLGLHLAATVLVVLFELAVMVPSFCVMVRRLHDRGHSGWFYCWCFIPLAGAIAVMVTLALPSDPNPNEYGEPR